MVQPCPVFAPRHSTTQLPVPAGPVTPATVPKVPPEVICSEKEVRISLGDAVAPVTVMSTKNPPDPSGPPEVKVNVTPPVDKQLLLEAQVSASATPARPKPNKARTAMVPKTLFITFLFSQVRTAAISRGVARENCNACTKGQVLPSSPSGSKSLRHKQLAALTKASPARTPAACAKLFRSSAPIWNFPTAD